MVYSLVLLVKFKLIFINDVLFTKQIVKTRTNTKIIMITNFLLDNFLTKAIKLRFRLYSHISEKLQLF